MTLYIELLGSVAVKFVYCSQLHYNFCGESSQTNANFITAFPAIFCLATASDVFFLKRARRFAVLYAVIMAVLQ